MFRKTMVLAMALGAVAAMALPATAGANWKHNGVPIQQPAQLSFTGTSIKFESKVIGGGVGCQVTSQVQLKDNQTKGTLTSFAAHPTSDTANCFGTGGLSFCQIHTLQPQAGFKWVIHTGGFQATSLTLTHGEITVTATGGFCPVHHVRVTAGTVEGHAESLKPSTIQITGKAHVAAEAKSTIPPPTTDANAEVSGLLHLEGTPTYEI